jgi:twitching motility protein PilJ
MSYKQAYHQYIHGNYSEAATLIDPLTADQPDDADLRLLRGHIYSGLQQYDIALVEYEAIQSLTEDPTLLDYANQGIATCRQFTNGANGTNGTNGTNAASDEPIAGAWQDQPSPALQDSPLQDNNGSSDWMGPETEEGSDDFSFESLDFDLDESPGVGTELSEGNPFAASGNGGEPLEEGQFANPFGAMGNGSFDSGENLDQDNPFFTDDLSGTDGLDDSLGMFGLADNNDSGFAEDGSNTSPFGTATSDSDENLNEDNSEDETLFMGGEVPGMGPDLSLGDDLGNLSGLEPEPEAANFQAPQGPDFNSEFSFETEGDFSRDQGMEFEDTFTGGDHDFTEEPEDYGLPATPPMMADDAEQTLFMDSPIEDGALNWESDTFDTPAPEPEAQTFVLPANSENMDLPSDFPLDDFAPDSAQFYDEDMSSDKIDSEYDTGLSQGKSAQAESSVSFLDDFDEDFGNFDDFAISDDSAGFTTPDVNTNFEASPQASGAVNSSELVDFSDSNNTGLGQESLWDQENLPAFTQTDVGEVEPAVTVDQGAFAFLENAPFATKRLVVAGVAGVAAGLCVLSANLVSARMVPQGEEVAVVRHLRNTGWMMFVAGLGGSALSTFLVGDLMFKHARRSTQDLQLQMSRVAQGDFNAQAIVHSEDEFGQLATGFNQMSRVILTTTKEAQRKAEEQEQQKEDLQRQVIRLLDDVEGAARGDLTVQAEVTADVLGAVADSFNLTIQNLREIVQQVKNAALQVNKASSDNETFARSLSSDALRQAEELAVTLNSVQVMTDSIQRVAESAREAEEVARTASATALRGGEAVEQTVAGILRIRETVAETTRKVKRLAESSQEISKIVALISQIASRTNLLALNASIEAARAGEAGRGFAIVADEVRQLADRAAKASKEIEQIVLQIQGETGSVMTAMEEGTQQVIEGTKLAEQAKRSLEDIIQVSNRIDQLVRSITADTVEQTETSRAVAQVMQSVELTAQETSQEAQRVSRSLQNLVGIARDLQTSVERFRVETSVDS